LGDPIREAVAVFDDAEQLEGAVSELQSSGIDRSELSFLAHPSLTGQIPRDLRLAADDPGTAREPVVSDTDLRQGRVLGTSLAATIAAFAAAGLLSLPAGLELRSRPPPWRRAVSEPPARYSGANSQRIRRHSSTRSSRAAAFCFGCVRATLPASK
jgi:hypothetical protein